MNNKHHITTQAELEQLISRYFDGETSVQEEQELREVLADCPWNSEAIDEARFTMGYFAAHCQEEHRVAKKNYRRQFIGIAASIAIILAIGIPALSHKWSVQQPECIAYVNGEVIADNQKAVMALIAQDLDNMDMATHEMDDAITNDMNAMDHASQSMEAQLMSIGEALELDNN